MKPGWLIFSLLLLGAAFYISPAAAGLAMAGTTFFLLTYINGKIAGTIGAVDDLVYAFTFTKEVALAPMIQNLCIHYLKWRDCRPRPKVRA